MVICLVLVLMRHLVYIQILIKGLSLHLAYFTTKRSETETESCHQRYRPLWGHYP